MFGFKKNKKTTQIKNNNEFYDRNGPVYQSTDHYGVKPEYFDYDKIQLNKFLTDDETYRNKIAWDNSVCDKFGNRKCKGTCCYEKRYISDMNAMNEINNDIENKLELESFSALAHARKAYDENKKDFINYDGTHLGHFQKPEDRGEKISSFFSLQKTKPMVDKYGLCEEDYQNISKNIADQAYAISNETRRMLLDQKTKVLNLDDLRDHHINSNIEAQPYQNNKIYQEKDFFWKLRKNPDAGTDPKIIAQHSFDNLIRETNNLNQKLQKNISTNEYNINAINNYQDYINQHSRLKEPESIIDIAREQVMNESKQANDTIDLDKLTPYNVVKPNIRVNKNNKRNITL